MSLFPRSFISANDPSSFHPLFRLLDDFDTYSRGSTSNNNNHHNRTGNVMKSFSPKFDVKELGEAYELHGELPGVDQKDVEIEFTDSQTVVIRGRTERTSTSDTPRAGLIEGSKTSSAISNKSHTAHNPTIEDTEDSSSADITTTKTLSAEEAQVANKKEDKSVPVAPQEKYWVSERSVGEFSRSFTFPVRIDSDNVQASMRNGVLSILVPKAKKDQARKITIN